MNCLAIEQSDGILVVDCGTSFPHDDLGVDVLHPDFSWLAENVERLRGVVITHGHEDHIGALPFLLDELDVPVWGPAHALALARRRLKERGFGEDELRLREVSVGTRFDVGPFQVEPIRVSHSIIEATALAIRTNAGIVLHTGDFHMDPSPPDGEPTDVARLEALGDEGVTLLLSDSTNIDVPERSPMSERHVGETLARLVSEAPARAFVVMFASNVQRLRLLGDIAQKAGRKISLFGRSLNTQVEIATRLGHLQWPSNLLVAAEDAESVPRDQLLVLAGGSQAEPNSAMRRLASNTHQHLKIADGDSVFFSSRVIPGNERVAFDMMCDLLRLGARVHTRVTDPGVHTSGHASRSEQRRMLELIRPRAFVPVHGTLHHLLRHADLARELGVDQVLVTENGTAVAYDAERGLRHDGGFPHGKVPIAMGGEPLSAEVLKRRADLGRGGVAVVSVALDADERAVAPPAVTTRGIPAVDDDPAALRSVAHRVAETLARRRPRRLELEEELRRAARRALVELSGTRPQIEILIVRV
ncbi:MAG: ribonuclease J [Myxococcales bacterium]|nr:ribonuclease J [Myxococcales bacterium]MCB9578903.1 ribonuclease J [Polyangiaceae bacterium]